MPCLHQTPRKTCFRKQEAEHINQSIQNESTTGCYVRLSLLSLQPTRSNQNCFWMPFWGSPLLDPKKLQNQQFYIIAWIRKKLLVDVANLGTCCHDDYDVLLEVLGTLGKCYVCNPVAKTLVGLKIMTGTTVFGCLPGAHLTGPKKASKPTILHNRLRKKLLVDVATLATCCHDDYDVLLEVLGTWANAMLVVLLPKLWKSWLAQLFLDVFLGLTHPYWTQKSFKTNNFT